MKLLLKNNSFLLLLLFIFVLFNIGGFECCAKSPNLCNFFPTKVSASPVGSLKFKFTYLSFILTTLFEFNSKSNIFSFVYLSTIL